MIKIDYYMSHGSPWTFLGHNRLGAIVKKYDAKLNILPVNYGDIFPGFWWSAGYEKAATKTENEITRVGEVEQIS